MWMKKDVVRILFANYGMRKTRKEFYEANYFTIIDAVNRRSY